ncbi:sulfate adenylyltransferase [Thiohalobacter sp. COW1]|uniref:Adenylyl-sulfate kinase n=1 Tax=Thiohalobacter thiocyanaticus TaxID=585455 RepID=A0A1Z4VN93_9GAMM|nr:MULTISPECIES: bifunctional sulfate adenylyltransferase/adenylylsulfate kinase [Thiohalobacter]BAZ92975.1 bifunctional sulfate adenylyltransferase subunit 1/adenylylsulfate kinase [Thiohalobacter thiocyanaticus]BCO32026.1 sulfate adenylyltransferase [Thiohalobacter sp. COW1]
MENYAVPHGGGELVDLLVDAAQAEALKDASKDFHSLTLSQRQLCDLELLMNGGFTPLDGFMNQAAYDSVLERMQLPDGTLWPVPIVLDVEAKFAEKLETGSKIALRDGEGFMPAVLTVEDIWTPDKAREAERVYGTQSVQHPGVRYLNEQVKQVYISGRIEGIETPIHYDFESLWDTPQELRHLLAKMGWRRVVAFQTSKVMHRLQRDITLEAAKQVGGHILLHPTVGMTKPGDLHYYARVHCYQAIRRHFPHNLAMLSLLPLAMRMAGPREALWHGIVHKNFGCSHFIVGPDHASPPVGGNGQAIFYSQYAAQELIAQHQDGLGIEMVPVESHLYVPRRGRYLPVSEIERDGEEGLSFSEAELRERIARNADIPDWFSYPEVITELKRVCPPRSRQGFTLFFTGLSGAGKSTLAKIIYAKLVEAGGRPVTLLDGDIVRQHLSSELGFSREHRNINVNRIGFVASEITKNGGVAICAPIAPYTAMRRSAREMIEEHGAFIEIHVATPLETCEDRDRKGLYAKARQGLIPEFTGISDPYEVPENPELRVDTTGLNPMEAAQEIYLYLLREGYLDSE